MQNAGDTEGIPTEGSEVAEFQGLYGAFHVSEILLQKIWLRGAFDASRARTTSGAPVTIVHPGAWNRLSGPDFSGARLTIDGREITGDVEVHFGIEAWRQHGHDTDPAYEQVVLHVVLFPPKDAATPAKTRGGREIPVLVLVDLLWHDLEEYAADDAVAALSGRDAIPLVEYLLGLSPQDRVDCVREAAMDRWREKVHYARLRIDRCGWTEACHLTALEILGYRSNREAMLRVGTRYPWSTWGGQSGGAGPTLDELVAAGADAWTLRGVRPANHPRQRLEQYRRWLARVPDWPERLRIWALSDISADVSAGNGGITAVRRRVGLPKIRTAFTRDLFGDQVGGLRADTLVLNLVLPFLATEPGTGPGAAAWWQVWTPGDVAEVLLEASRRLSPPQERTIRTNATVQGLLGLHVRRSFPARSKT